MSHVDPFRVPAVAISKDERAFFKRLGARVAELRKARDITQVQVAEHLGVSQQTANAYETGYRRIPVSALPPLARFLGVSLDELVGETTQAKKRGPTPRLQQQLEQISQLPRAKQRFVIEMLDTVLQQTG
ncbi:MAG TPA: helix-turn-helix transcriptional regulator [Woeseiaceae bacterium]|nr:helix-turn-helix transcriptional regulator [Woeseiaceae bacterium]